MSEKSEHETLDEDIALEDENAENVAGGVERPAVERPAVERPEDRERRKHHTRR